MRNTSPETRFSMSAWLQPITQQEANRQDTERTFDISLPALERDWSNDLDAEYDDLGEPHPDDLRRLETGLKAALDLS